MPQDRKWLDEELRPDGGTVMKTEAEIREALRTYFCLGQHPRLRLHRPGGAPRRPR